MAWKTIISNPPDLAQRVEKLEKANRRLEFAGVLALTLVGCLLLLGAASPKRTVSAEEFILRDEDGDLRVSLHMTASGPALSLFDANGKVRAVLAMGADGPMLLLADANEVSRALLGVLEVEAGLALFDANGKVIFTAP